MLNEWKLDGKDISCINIWDVRKLIMKSWLEHNSGMEGKGGSVTRFKANWYECLRGIWKSMAVPSIMYGTSGL